MTTEMNLTAREIRLIAFEASTLDLDSTDLTGQLSARADRFVRKATTIGTWNPRYVIGRCFFLINGIKL